MRRVLESEDRRNVKRDEDIDVRKRLILTDANGVRYSITVSTAGALVVTAL